MCFELRVVSRELSKARALLFPRDSKLAARGPSTTRWLKGIQRQAEVQVIGAPRLRATHDSQLDERQRKTYWSTRDEGLYHWSGR